MSENAEILKYLKTGNKLTCLKAIRLGLSHNLRSRISDLDKNHCISRQYINVTKRGGKRANVMQYWID